MADPHRDLIESTMRKWARAKGIPSKYISTWPVAASDSVLAEIFDPSGTITFRVPRERLSGFSDDQVETYVLRATEKAWVDFWRKGVAGRRG